MSDTHDRAVESMKELLWELPAEFSNGPPDVKGEGRSSFQVIKHSNVRKVHQALWDLQVHFGLDQPTETLDKTGPVG